MLPLSFGLYLHIPFCIARCPYCDFNTYAGLESLFEAYVAALREEIGRSGTTWGRPQIRTIFIGGGTPSVLSPALLRQLLDACYTAFDVEAGAEITSEANPGTVDWAKYSALREMGVNRLSLGVQSFDDAELRWLGRIHNASEAENAYAVARKAGFGNINLDFMFGLQRQSPETWIRTLKRAVALKPEHISLYSLTVEPGTPLADRVHRHLEDEPDDDLAADLYLAANDLLASAGYRQYEISNWARADGGSAATVHGRRSFVCRHNLVYWHGEPYLGLGAGAHSFDGRRRWWNASSVPDYIARISTGRPQAPEAGGEVIEGRLAMGELMMLRLRLVAEGMIFEDFVERFGVALDDVFGEQIAALVASGLLERLPDRVRLTPRGRLLGNRVFMEFL